MATIQEINSTIMFGSFTNDQLVSIIDAIKFRRGQLSRENKRSITIGSQVKFFNSKQGISNVGTVKKIAIKFVTVDTGAGLWRVPAAMLETV
jgi:hypothetical protein